MERIKAMKLKRALFIMTFISLSTAALLSALAFWGCQQISEQIAPQGITIQMESGELLVDGGIAVQGQEVPDTSALAHVLSVLQIVLPIIFFITAVSVTAALFYRWKLKEPLAVLADGADRVMNCDLDFTLPALPEDELGELCAAFERMRRSLLENNRALWRQAEERKRLNAAFSHDLRNPVTVLKGSVKMAEQCAAAGETQQEELCSHLARMKRYTERIEQYVEAMSSVQRLEQVRIVRAAAVLSDVAAELEAALRFVAADNKKRLIFYYADAAENAAASVFLDKNVLFQAVENLVSNALRFACQTVSVTLSREEELLVCTVADDGGGFSGAMLEKGVQPFQKGEDDTAHLGMGLYSTMLLCRKHGGFLRIGNGETGARVCAAFKISGEISPA